MLSCIWIENVVGCKVKSASEVITFSPRTKKPLFVTILDPFSNGGQLRRRQQDNTRLERAPRVKMTVSTEVLA
jgi:hypothetical protein